MHPLDLALLSAWHTLAPSIRADRLELARRAARLHDKTLSRPIRPWCAAIRASDTRLAAHATLIPRDAPERLLPHTLLLDTAAIRELIRPVAIPYPGIEHTHAADRLGITPEQLARHIKTSTNTFTVRRFPPSMFSKRGRPIPLIYAPHNLDPNTPAFRPPDAVWGSAWQYHHERIPLGFTAVLKRIPVFCPDPRGRRAHTDGRHRGWRFICPGPRPLFSLPHILTGDITALTEQPRTRACGRAVAKLYLPLPVWTIPDALGDTAPLPEGGAGGGLIKTPSQGEGVGGGPPSTSDRTHTLDPRSEIRAPSSLPSAIPTLACHHCLRIRYFSALDNNAWNLFIAHMTRGLLYGSEVQRPSAEEAPEIQPMRRRRYAPRTGDRSPRRDAVANLICEGLNTRQIAIKLGLKPDSVTSHTYWIFKRHHVHTRAQLIAKLRPDLTPDAVTNLARRASPRADQIEQLLARGHSLNEIAERLGLTPAGVRSIARLLYPRHNVRNRRELIAKLKLAAPQTPSSASASASGSACASASASASASAPASEISNLKSNISPSPSTLRAAG